MAYFLENYSKLSFPIGKPGFRPAQLAAIQAVSAHFFNYQTPAIVVMPTGAGNTTVAAALAFTLKVERVLVVTPSRLLREQIAEKFQSLIDLEQIRALEVLSDKPRVKIIDKKVKDSGQWEALRKVDVAVATVNSISGLSDDLPAIPEDLFDLVIIDEGHHAPAATWAKILDQLKGSKQVLLTATPFRRDAKEIKGKIVFTYDIRRAHDDGVFGDLSFQAAQPVGGETADEAIAREAERQFKEDRANGYEHLLMVRVDSLQRGRLLEKVYQKTGLRLRFISGNSALSTVKRANKELRSGDLDGIICVNMFGEGFDLPRLKIAALHSPHKSLAVTLQFIGRFARTTDPKIGRATFIAYPKEQSNELQELWTSGAPWPDFVHGLSASRIDSEKATREALETFKVDVAPELTGLSLTAIHPYFHAKLYHCLDGIDFAAEMPKSSNEMIVYRAVSEETGAIAIISQSVSKPRWISDSRLSNVQFELDIIHYNSQNRILFICSSRKTVDHYRKLSTAFANSRLRDLSASSINMALNDIDGLQFFSVGMRKRQVGGRTESYRTLAGPSADQAVDELDGQYFDRGHSFGKGRSDGKEVTIGISSSSKIWSNTVRLIPDLVSWCDALAERIGSGRAKPTGSGIDRLSAGEPITEITSPIIFAIFGDKTYCDPPMVTVGDNEDRGSLPDFDIEIVSSDSSMIHFRLASGALSWDAIYDLNGVPLIRPFEESEEEPLVGHRGSQVLLSDYLSDFPPRFFLENMDVIQGASLFPSPTGSVQLSPGDIETIDWKAEGVDIELEKPSGYETKGSSLFTWLESRLRQSGAEFVFNDDGAGEVADYIAIEGLQSDPVVTLYHCKASSTSKAGSRIGDLEIVCGQVVRCGVWLGGRKLLDQIDHRIRTRGTNGQIVGNIEDLRQIYAADVRQRVRFRVVVVQPGVSKGKLRTGPHQLLLAAKAYATAASFDEFKVIGSA